MKLHRFFDETISSPLVSGSRYEILNPDVIHQIGRVLRMKEGERLIVCDGDNTDYEMILLNMTKKSLLVEVEGVRKVPPMVRDVMICAALVKGSRFDETLLHVVEVGVSHVIPLISHRTEKKDLNRERALRILREGAEQSGRGTIPLLYQAMTPKEALWVAKQQGRKLLWCDVGARSHETAPSDKSVAVFIGPEGGFTPEETKAALEEGAEFVSLGQTVLRSETAALVAGYVAVNGFL